MKKNGFTLAEVLITLAIIGVVAAISIPSVISNSQQQEFKTGLRKAVSVLNSSITMNMALDGETPYDNKDLFNFLQKHMAVMKSVSDIKSEYYTLAPHNGGSYSNAAFYTTDGMKFEFRKFNQHASSPVLYESGVRLCYGNTTYIFEDETMSFGENCGGCGSYGLNSNSDNTTKPPCLITIDVNGDRKPNPSNVNCKSKICAKVQKYSDPTGVKLTDMFNVMITDKQAVPFGVAAQRAMYQAQK